MNFCSEILEIDKKSNIELEYLTFLSKKFDVINNIKENIFHFYPTYDKNGRNQTFASFYKETILNELSYKLIFLILQKLTNYKEKEILEEIADDIYYKEILELKEKSIFKQFFLKNNLNNLFISEIVDLFLKQYNKKINELIDV